MDNGTEVTYPSEAALSSGWWAGLAGDSAGLGSAESAGLGSAGSARLGSAGSVGPGSAASAGLGPAARAGPGPGGPGAVYGHGRSLVFLHGLTFDRAMWRPALSRLPRGHPALALDLPGHGESPPLPTGDHGLDGVVEAVHEAVVAAGLDEPVMVGHSLSGLFVTAYAARYPSAAVVNIDQPLRVDEFALFAQSIAPRLRGEDFGETWGMLQARMRTENVDATARDLLRAGDTVSQRIVLSYWSELLDLRVGELVRRTDAILTAVRERRVPYVALFGDTVDATERAWLVDRLPGMEIVEWPVGHHFPHVTEASRFAALLTGLLAARP